MNPDRILYRMLESPVGNFVAGATSHGCCLFEFGDRGGLPRIKKRVEKRYRMEMIEGSNESLESVEKEVYEYFEGTRKLFTVRLDLKGTRFEMAVWDQLLRIPYGETKTYGAIASLIGKKGAARAVGRANGANYIAIIVPCHRVIEEGGGLRGYGGGLWRKKLLLELEQGIDPLFAGFNTTAIPFPSKSPA